MQKRPRKRVETLPYPDLHYQRDCGMFVAAFAEFLSDEINMSYDSFRSDYLRKKICNAVMEVWSRQGQC
ncbi:hypothetical protein H5410_043020 [Solanum commersonii]|uniref:Ulp1 protease family, C-terminal catalytic domain containing protein n=1 Tax=Solanum commersonii TaxID=4109 RepID=A0A9J5XXN6_SOLCO|nr:hypothetical protein H5410_043020 [Solanum commersonii]